MTGDAGRRPSLSFSMNTGQSEHSSLARAGHKSRGTSRQAGCATGHYGLSPWKGS